MTKPSTHGTKECNKCHQILSIENFAVIEKRWRRGECIECGHAYIKKRRLENKWKGEIKESLVADTNGSLSHVSANNMTPRMTKPSTRGTKECKTCHQLLSIDCFRISRGKEKAWTTNICSRCNNLKARLYKQTHPVKKQTGCVTIAALVGKSGNPIPILKRSVTKPYATGTIWISSFTILISLLLCLKD